MPQFPPEMIPIIGIGGSLFLNHIDDKILHLPKTQNIICNVILALVGVLDQYNSTKSINEATLLGICSVAGSVGYDIRKHHKKSKHKKK